MEPTGWVQSEEDLADPRRCRRRRAQQVFPVAYLPAEVLYRAGFRAARPFGTAIGGSIGNAADAIGARPGRKAPPSQARPIMRKRAAKELGFNEVIEHPGEMVTACVYHGGYARTLSFGNRW